MQTLPRDDNNVPLEGTYRNMTSGTATVVTSGTPVQLPTAECKRIDIVAPAGNSGTLFVGGSTTLASTGTGIPLNPTGSYTFYVINLNLVWIDSTSSSDKISYVYFN